MSREGYLRKLNDIYDAQCVYPMGSYQRLLRNFGEKYASICSRQDTKPKEDREDKKRLINQYAGKIMMEKIR